MLRRSLVTASFHLFLWRPTSQMLEESFVIWTEFSFPVHLIRFVLKWYYGFVPIEYLEFLVMFFSTLLLSRLHKAQRESLGSSILRLIILLIHAGSEPTSRFHMLLWADCGFIYRCFYCPKEYPWFPATLLKNNIPSLPQGFKLPQIFRNYFRLLWGDWILDFWTSLSIYFVQCTYHVILHILVMLSCQRSGGFTALFWRFRSFNHLWIYFDKFVCLGSS